MSPTEAAIGFRHFHDQLAHLKQRLLDMRGPAGIIVALAEELF